MWFYALAYMCYFSHTKLLIPEKQKLTNQIASSRPLKIYKYESGLKGGGWCKTNYQSELIKITSKS